MNSEAPNSSTEPCKMKKRGAKKRSPRPRPPSLDTGNINGSSSSSLKKEEVVEFVDEEALYNMPLLVDSMAQGMLLTPPALKKGFNWTHDNPHIDFDFTLWKH
ncbi:dehydration-responsive element-binding protein 1F-like [Salvia hispanica]|uniref:dehydration-responsive element-binding protein 1F-like n=1 Tax=Salvia hispanica TaxID=49212 RepID=UPI002009490F|nr:dehydration-responsive element-binding protein 1F-like [Salvia hispanica]